jgi:putative inorganic carbon (hco3(-)) transporter
MQGTNYFSKTDTAQLAKPDYWIAGCATVAYICACMFFVAQQQYLPLLLPFGLAVFMLALLSIDKLMMLLAFLVPISIQLSTLDPLIGFDIDLPTEPILVIATGVFCAKFLISRRYDTKLIKHPVSIAIAAYIMWYFFTAIASSMFIVSLKASISFFWLVVPFYFVAAEMFRNKENVWKYFVIYASSLSIVSIYTLVQHSENYFSLHTAYTIMKPFFNDHTSYGAALAFIVPLLVGIILAYSKAASTKILLSMMLGLLVLATVFSYTRAAWLGLIAAAGIWLLMVTKIKLSYLLFPALIMATLLFLNKEQIIMSMAQTRAESSASISEHLSSVTNIKSDDSNMERLNRWSCAYRMFLEKPVMGWGPGTYMFNYAPFQLYKDRTRISTNAADLGNAHSEYLGALAEKGIVGALLLLSIVGLTVMSALRSYRKAITPWAEKMALFALMAMATYYLHGLLNNFLDTDKIAALFWPITALIVVIDVYGGQDKINNGSAAAQTDKNSNIS